MTTSHGRSLTPGGWRRSVQGPAVIPRPAGSPKPQKEHAPIPAPLSRPAPLWLACPFCKLPQLATPDRVLLWHRMEWRGEQVECTGTNTVGYDLEEVG